MKILQKTYKSISDLQLAINDLSTAYQRDFEEKKNVQLVNLTLSSKKVYYFAKLYILLL